MYIPSTNPSASKFHAKSSEDWLLGLAVLEELVKLNGMTSAGLSCATIAAAVGCSEQAIQKVEAEAIRKIRLRMGSVKNEVQEFSLQRLRVQPKKIKVRSKSLV